MLNVPKRSRAVQLTRLWLNEIAFSHNMNFHVYIFFFCKYHHHLIYTFENKLDLKFYSNIYVDFSKM